MEPFFKIEYLVFFLSLIVTSFVAWMISHFAGISFYYTGFVATFISAVIGFISHHIIRIEL